MDIKLKPCPFCGGTQNRALYYDDYGISGNPQYVVTCCKCLADGPRYEKGIPDSVSRELAAKLWNRRHKDE